MFKRFSIVYLVALLFSSANAQPTLNGSISGSEGWTLVSENSYGVPSGGQVGASDLVGETASQNWWDGINGVNVPFADNRGDIVNLYVQYDSTYLYVGVAGPTLPFNSWTDAGGNNDMGDLFIAIDASGGLASGSLTANEGHPGFGISGEGVRAVDFLGWAPTQILGVQYADNGGGGGGFANIFDTVLNTDTASGAQGGSNPFAWNAGVNGSASYDTVNGNAGEYEFRIPWTLLGYAGPPTANQPFRFAAYTTLNFGGSDVFDSGPGNGQNSSYEEIGDFPGDLDAVGATPFLGAGDAGTIPGGSFPGANFVDSGTYSFDAAPNHLDEIDTIQGYYQIVVPEPTTMAAMLLGLVALFVRRRR